MNRRKFAESFRYAVEGVMFCIGTQKNMRIHLVIAVITLIAGCALRISKVEFILVLISITMVFCCEIINTAIEKAVDTATQEYHPMAKIAKDVAAGAVLVSAFNAAAVGFVIFAPRLQSLIIRL